MSKPILSALLGLSTLVSAFSVPNPLADLRRDYDAAGAFSEGVTSSGLIADANGGAWNFFSSATLNPTDGGADLTLLTYTSLGEGVRFGNAFVREGQDFDLPGWSNSALIDPVVSEGSPDANELAVHPGNALHAVARWTSNYSGTISLDASLRDTVSASDGLRLGIYHNGASIYVSGATVGNTPETYSADFNVAAGDFLYFVVDRNGAFDGDSAALSVSIIPEPGAFAALAGFAVLGLAAARRRARQVGK